MSELSPFGKSEGYGVCPDDMEGKELRGVACLLDA